MQPKSYTIIQHKYKEYAHDVGFNEAKPTTGKILGLPSQEPLRKKEYIKTYKTHQLDIHTSWQLCLHALLLDLSSVFELKWHDTNAIVNHLFLELCKILTRSCSMYI